MQISNVIQNNFIILSWPACCIGIYVLYGVFFLRVYMLMPRFRDISIVSQGREKKSQAKTLSENMFVLRCIADNNIILTI